MGTQMKISIKVDTFDAMYMITAIIILTTSFLPILNDILTFESWKGYGWNAYVYINGLYEVKYSDIFQGDDKPIIRVFPPYYFANPVNLIEFNGYDSYICNYNMIRDAINISINVRNKNVLEIIYTYQDMNLTQEVAVLSDLVFVKYRTSNICNFRLTLRRSYYESVLNISFINIEQHNMKIPWAASLIEFTFKDEETSTTGIGIIETNKPVEAVIERNTQGINKIWILINNTSDIVFKVKVNINEKIKSLNISNIFSYRAIRYVIPIISLSLLILLYRPLRKKWIILNDKTRILLAALIMRLVLTPFFVHLWDINTIQVSVYQFINKVNPYEYVYNTTQKLRSIAGLSINYEGFAYLPHALFFFIPPYFLYLSLGGDPLPIRGVRDPMYYFTFYFHPNIYLFLFTIKLPLIMADLVIVSILYDYSGEKTASLYAFSPYIIFINSMWGMFDNIIALTLLLTIVLLKKNRVISAGFMYGISLTKLYTAYAIVPLTYNVWKQGKTKSLIGFILGAVVSQIPTLYFLYKNPLAFISSTLLFHGSRPGGGVNPFNVLWNIKDLNFNIMVSNMITAISLTLTLLVSLYTILKKMDLERAVISTCISGILLGKITNEQYLVPVYTLLLLYTHSPYVNESTRKLSIGYLIFALINTRLIYICSPMLALIGRVFEYQIREVIKQLFYIESYYYLSNIALFTLGVKLFILEAFLLIFLLFPYNTSSNVSSFANNEKVKIRLRRR